MKNVVFEIQDGKIGFSIPDSPLLEKRVRMTIKKQTARADKAFYFKRGILDALQAIEQSKPREFGTPMVEVTDPFTGEIQVMTCQEAKELLELGMCLRIRQISGHPLPAGYFENL
jgi:hypothetical protein